MFLHFVAFINRQFEQKIKYARSDNDTVSNCLKPYFLQQGIIFETSCVKTPQHNGTVERKHNHILNVAGALRFQANLSLKVWGDCVQVACHLINRTPSVVLDYKTPYECLFGKPPTMTDIKIFGCLCYAYNISHGGDKFASKSRRCIFLGYFYTQKGWKLYDLETKKYFVSRIVKFIEHKYPFGASEPLPVSYNVSQSVEYCEEEMHMPLVDAPVSVEGRLGETGGGAHDVEMPRCVTPSVIPGHGAPHG